MFDLIPDIIECQIDDKNNIECSYRPCSSVGKFYVSKLLQRDVDVSVFDNIEMIGYHPKDDFSYSSECVSATIKWNNCPSNLYDFCTLKSFKTHLVYKYYRPHNKEEFDFLKKITSLFKGAWPALEFGTGFYPDDSKYRDVYFYAPAEEHQAICDFFEKNHIYVPNSCQNAKLAHYGITIGANYEVFKLKRYFHGLDPLMKNWTSILGSEDCVAIYKQFNQCIIK